MSAGKIRAMGNEDLLDMYYFLYEDDAFLDDVEG